MEVKRVASGPSALPQVTRSRGTVVVVASHLLLAIEAVSGLGCGTESSPGHEVGDASGGSGGGGMPAGAGGSTSTAGGSGGSGGSSAESDAAGSTSFGEIVFYAPHFSSNATYYASFGDPAHPQAPSAYACTGTNYGPCNVSECTVGDAGTDPAMAKKPQAGTIAVSSGDAGFSETLVPDANGNYMSKSLMRTPLTGGELLDFSATGGEVPAFHETVENPLVFLLSEPGLPDAGTLIVSRANDLKLVWARGIAEGTFLLQANSGNLNGATVGLNCSVAADVGTMTIPAAALSKIGAKTVLQLITVRNHAFQAGSYAVTIRVATEVATPDKRGAASITLE
jgi:hypothetical protein